jgi:hypothetical protein
MVRMMSSALGLKQPTPMQIGKMHAYLLTAGVAASVQCVGKSVSATGRGGAGSAMGGLLSKAGKVSNSERECAGMVCRFRLRAIEEGDGDRALPAPLSAPERRRGIVPVLSCQRARSSLPLSVVPGVVPALGLCPYAPEGRVPLTAPAQGRCD